MVEPQEKDIVPETSSQSDVRNLGNIEIQPELMQLACYSN